MKVETEEGVIEISRLDSSSIKIEITRDGSETILQMNAIWLLKIMNDLGFKIYEEEDCHD